MTPSRDYGAPPVWHGFEHLELYGSNLHSWVNRTGYRPELRAGKVIESLPVEVQQKFKAIRRTLDYRYGVDKLLEHLAVLNGERPGERLRLAVSTALFRASAHRGEALTDFAARRDS